MGVTTTAPLLRVSNVPWVATKMKEAAHTASPVLQDQLPLVKGVRRVINALRATFVLELARQYAHRDPIAMPDQCRQLSVHLGFTLK